MTDNGRAARLADRIKVLVAKILERGIRDPRLGFVTLTDVRVTGDLQHATIFYTVYGTDEERKSSAVALKRATGRIRSEVGKNLNIRLVPTLEFVHDALPENAAHLDDLLAKAREQDAAVAREREGKSYAGDENPYETEEDS
ncbi:30S ribosome-binding factor RbfA [Gulosibacter molinativorax]|uniref:Ribosome-binding factor A n=1 Tax=Gulosibacter molinativorax TaxID=256821 RepID=A0ABT7C3L9_9MICO|nr:30S ribosome-binding factor RbfA [Gulosibacter molinativorax]MDJ1369850.1 30S ribosome-binding factor RbfA [Gulosibacter molinativorax]QUY61815.1 Ribosome-binding factor A [Gulosibacter molinativorax]